MTQVVVAEIPENAARDLGVGRSILGSDVELVRHSLDGNEEYCTDEIADHALLIRQYIHHAKQQPGLE